MTQAQTEGERLFEQYLSDGGYAYEFEKAYVGKKKRPDYTILKNGETFLCDVKDFDPMELRPGFMQFDPYFRIRQRIDDGRKKFKEFKEFPCVVVLRNTGNAFVDIETPAIVLAAMYGDSGFKVPIYVGHGTSPTPPPPIQHAFGGRGKMVRRWYSQNTTISALVSLRYIALGMCRLRKIYRDLPGLRVSEAIEAAGERFPNFDLDECHLGVIVWENSVARIPLSRQIFTGRYDLRWGIESGDQTIVFEGEELRELT